MQQRIKKPTRQKLRPKLASLQETVVPPLDIEGEDDNGANGRPTENRASLFSKSQAIPPPIVSIKLPIYQ